MAPSSFSNRELLEALSQVALDDDPVKRRRVYAELLKARLLVLTPQGEGELAVSETGTPKELAVELFTLQAEDGRGGLPVFTDEDALRRWDPPEGLVSLLLDGPTVCQLALQSAIDAVVINPGGPAGGELGPPELEALARGEVPESGMPPTAVVRAGTKVAFGPPEGPPPARFVDRLRDVAPAHPEITACYLYTMGLGEETPRLTLGLALADELEVGEIQRLFGDLISELGNTMDGLGEVQATVVGAEELPAVAECGLKVFAR